MKHKYSMYTKSTHTPLPPSTFSKVELATKNCTMILTKGNPLTSVCCWWVDREHQKSINIQLCNIPASPANGYKLHVARLYYVGLVKNAIKHNMRRPELYMQDCLQHYTQDKTEFCLRKLVNALQKLLREIFPILFDNITPMQRPIR